MKTFLSDDGERSLRATIEHFNVSLAAGDEDEVADAARDLLDVARAHRGVLQLRLLDLMDQLEGHLETRYAH